MGGKGNDNRKEQKTVPYYFDYISKKNPIIKNSFAEIAEIIRQVQDDLRNDITFQFKPVGKYSRNMITWDKKSNLDYDFDFNPDIWKGYGDFLSSPFSRRITTKKSFFL